MEKVLENIKEGICPVCNHELTTETFKDDVHGAPTVVETQIRCDNCKQYLHETSYGEEVELFAGREISSFATSSGFYHYLRSIRILWLEATIKAEEFSNKKHSLIMVGNRGSVVAGEVVALYQDKKTPDDSITEIFVILKNGEKVTLDRNVTGSSYFVFEEFYNIWKEALNS